LFSSLSFTLQPGCASTLEDLRPPIDHRSQNPRSAPQESREPER
jgi:hypothetical protein